MGSWKAAFIPCKLINGFSRCEVLEREPSTLQGGTNRIENVGIQGKLPYPFNVCRGASNDKVWATESFYHHLGYSKRSFGLLFCMQKEKLVGKRKEDLLNRHDSAAHTHVGKR